MTKNLMIVESPAKAKTIEGYLGKDFTVKSCFGHIRDLPTGDNAIKTEEDYRPVYEVPSDKKKVVAELKKLAKEAEMVWLATDEDREGEAISWHLKEALDLKDNKIQRIVFHEITKPAIQAAVQNPRGININLVNAQQARRVLDRLVGYELSPVLWKKIRPSLSAGRVQSVAVRLIVEREREIQEFTTEASYRVTALFLKGKEVFRAELNKRFAQKGEAARFLEQCLGAAFRVESLQTRPVKRSPAPPFTTSTLQQEASRKLGYSVSRTMTLAQRLYESGKITYMRTDSVALSQTAIQGAAAAINNMYGAEYHQSRQFKTKSSGAQEAHEAIRPTYFEQSSAGSDSGEQRLYELIWKRALASQMKEALLEKTTVQIGVAPAATNAPAAQKFVAEGEVIKFDGFLRAYEEGRDEENLDPNMETDSDPGKNRLPALKEGDALDLKYAEARERFSRPPARYTEASLVKKLEELGIGRPSTYAPTISTIQKRGYVLRESREGKERTFDLITLEQGQINAQVAKENTGVEKNKLFPSDIGMLVTDFLKEHFTEVMDYDFTAKVELQFDEIAEGLKDWWRMIDSFYKPFHKNVSKTLEEAKRPKGERFLGNDPVSGEPISVKIGRYGPYVQRGEASEDKKPQYASIKSGTLAETIGLQEALEMFRLPRTLGQLEGEDVVADIGRFGPYVRQGKTFASIPKDKDPLTISLADALELVRARKEQQANRLIKSFPERDDVQVLNGRYGPYIVVAKKNVRIPKGTEPASLTLEQCLELAEKTPDKKGRGRATKPAAKAKAGSKKTSTQKKAGAAKAGAKKSGATKGAKKGAKKS